MRRNGDFGLACLLGSALLCFSGVASAQSSQDSYSYVRPEIVKTQVPAYPQRALYRVEDGWVLVGFMVDKEGKPFESYVQRSVGGKDFEEEALAAVDQFEFKPATVNGREVASHFSYNFRFTVADVAGTARGFLRDFGQFMEALEAGEPERAQKELRSMENLRGKSHFNHAYLNFAKYRYAMLNGSKQEQLDYLLRAIVVVKAETGKDEEVYLPPELLKAALHELFWLQIDLGLYVESVETLFAIRRSGLEANLEQYGDVMRQLRELSEGDQAFTVPATANAEGKWRVGLYKRGFYLDSPGISVNALKLRCQNRFAELEYVEGNQYKIPESWRDCELEVSSDANASYNLVQF